MSATVEDFKKIVFADCNLEIDVHDLSKVASEISSYPEKFWYFCTYRKCFLLCLYGNSKVTEKESIDWLEHTNAWGTKTRCFVERWIQPHFYTLPRIIVLKTPPFSSIPVHIDCNSDEVDRFNPKLRVRLSGAGASLEFLKDDGSYALARPNSKIHFMSGSFAHRLVNNTSFDRITLCFGAPWSFTSAKASFYSSLDVKAENVILAKDIGSVLHDQYGKDWSQHRLVAQGMPS